MDADADADADADTDADTDTAVDRTNALCGTVAYVGAYTGPDVSIHIRVYKETGSASDNPVAAVGEPDVSTSRRGPGAYRADVDGYTGNLYVSAFMDVDGSGQEGGPTGRDTLVDGVLSDPMGAYGGYTFTSEAATVPTVVPFTAAGVTGIDIALADSGVITGTINASAGAAGGGTVGAFVPEPNGKFLHHTHLEDFADGMVYHLAIPPGELWLIRAKVGSNVGYYPDNPPPQPPANADPVSVTANAVTAGIDITLGGS